MTTTEDIKDAILSTAADSREHRAECDAYLPRIAAVWADVSPEHTGRYKHSIHIERHSAPLTEAGLRHANRSATSTTKPGRPPTPRRHRRPTRPLLAS